MEPKIKELIDLANKILEKETSYSDYKKIIFNYFNNTPITMNTKPEDRLLIIKTRLILIDSTYSTNIRRNRFALDDLANAIYEFKTDEELKKQSRDLIKYLDKKNPVITNLFDLECGKEIRHLPSLTSKYLHFLNKYQFPIYDSLVKKQIKYNGNEVLRFLDLIIKKNKQLEINNFEDLDKLLWVKGKIESEKYDGLKTREELNSKDCPKEIKEFKDILKKIDKQKR